MRRSQPADRAQRDDEEIRPRRVDAESIATAIPVVIDGKARQAQCIMGRAIAVVGHITDGAIIVITPARQPQGG